MPVGVREGFNKPPQDHWPHGWRDGHSLIVNWEPSRTPSLHGNGRRIKVAGRQSSGLPLGPRCCVTLLL